MTHTPGKQSCELRHTEMYHMGQIHACVHVHTHAHTHTVCMQDETMKSFKKKAEVIALIDLRVPESKKIQKS